MIRAATNVPVSRLALHRQTNDGLPGDSVDAQKIWITPDANIQTSPRTATTSVTTNQTLARHVNVSPTGAGFVNAPDGTVISFSLVSGPGSFVGPASCTTYGGRGWFTFAILCAVPGVMMMRAATNVTV